MLTSAQPRCFSSNQNVISDYDSSANRLTCYANITTQAYADFAYQIGFTFHIGSPSQITTTLTVGTRSACVTSLKACIIVGAHQCKARTKQIQSGNTHNSHLHNMTSWINILYSNILEDGLIPRNRTINITIGLYFNNRCEGQLTNTNLSTAANVTLTVDGELYTRHGFKKSRFYSVSLSFLPEMITCHLGQTAKPASIEQSRHAHAHSLDSFT